MASTRCTTSASTGRTTSLSARASRSSGRTSPWAVCSQHLGRFGCEDCRVSRPVLDQLANHDAALAAVEANGRLTATTGTLLTLLLLTEGWTLLDVRGYITLHTALRCSL